MNVDEFKEEFPGILPENPTTTNRDDPMRHNVGGSMNRPTRNEDPLSPRNISHVEAIEDGTPLDEHDKLMIAIKGVLTDTAKLLKAKNKKYGNSALNPIRVFSSADSVEQIKVRIDDKLSRIANQNKNDDEDAIKDLIGYLVLLTIVNDRM